MKKLPSLGELELVSKKIKSIPNRRREHLRKVHYGCYLLCSQSGLRISEAISFDLANRTSQGLYHIKKSKGKKERFVYIPKKVIKELRKHNWKPNSTNRYNFYHFLRKVKQETNIGKSTELTPHTLRRAFTTYHAESGMPLPLLSKLLGHSSIRTTALYWRDIYSNDGDPSDILAGKKWLEQPKTKPPLPENSASPIRENLPEQFPKNPNSDILRDKLLITAEKPDNKDNSLLTTETEPKLAIISYYSKPLIRQISPKNQAEFSLTSKQLPIITKREQPTEKEQVLLAKIKQLEEQLAKIQAENNHLKLENKHLKSLISKDQETEVKVVQLLPLK